MTSRKQNKQQKNILWVTIIIFIATLFVFPFFSRADVNKQINYQGKLTDATNSVVPDGSYDMTFKLYDADTSGTLLWTGTHTTTNSNPVAVTGGIFSVLLGSGTGNTLSLDFNSNSYYLQVEIYNSDTPAWETLSPRKQLGSTPSSFNSDRLDGLDSAESGANAHIVKTDSSGNLTISGNTYFNGTTYYVNSTGTANLNGLTLAGNLNLGANTITTTNTTLVSNLNADLLDGQHGSYYLGASNISGTSGYIPKFTGVNTLGDSLLYDNGSGVGIGTNSPDGIFGVNYMSAVPYYTKLLLHADGSDNSTVFTDSSDYAHPVTAYGNAKISTSQSKFGGSSALFDGSGDYLSAPDSDDWFLGTDNFTIDFWFRPSAYPAVGSYFPTFCSQYVNTSNTQYFAWYSPSAGVYSLIFGVDAIGMTGVYPFQLNTWHHIAVVRDGLTSTKLYVNGAQVGSTYTTNYAVKNLTASFKLGGYYYGGADLNGSLDEFRFSKGVARWTSNFTPPTSAYTNGESSSASAFVVSSAGNVGIGDATPSALLAVGNGDLFQVNSFGNLIKVNNVAYSWPNANATSNGQVLTSDTSGNLSWSTISSGSSTFLGLTDTPSSYNTGRILFETSSGISDNTNLFWDDTNQRLGIGTIIPDANLSISSASGSQFINLHDSTNDDSVGIYSGSGSPEGTVSAQIGSIYSDNASGRIYKKSSGDDTNIGWEEFTNTSSTAHMAKMTRDAVQSIPTSTVTKINLDTEVFDIGDIASTSTGRFTIGKSGKYLVEASWKPDFTTTANKVASLYIYKNGVSVKETRIQTAYSGTFYYGLEAVEILDLNAGDYIELYLLHNNGTTINTDTASSFKPRMAVVQLDDANGGESLFTDSGTETYLTSTTDDLILGSNTNTNAPFYLDVSTNSLRLGSGATTDASLNLYASDGDTGSLTYTTNDTFYFTGGNIQSDQFIIANSATGGLITRVQNSTPTAEADGLIIIDSSNGRLYFQYGGAPHYVNQTGGFQIPNYEVAPPDQINKDGKKAADEALPFESSNFPSYLTEKITPGELLIPYVDEYMSDGAAHGLYARFADVKDIMLKETDTKILTLEDANKILDSKTAENITTLEEIKKSTADQLDVFDEDIDEIKTNLANLEEKTEETNTLLTTIDTRVISLEDQMKTLKEQNEAVIDFAIAMNMESLLYKDALGNLDLGNGKLMVTDIEALGTIKSKDIEAENGIKGAVLELGENTSGKGMIKAGETEVLILTPYASEDVKIAITPRGSTFGKNIFVDSIVEGESIKVKIDDPAISEDINFYWVIIK